MAESLSVYYDLPEDRSMARDAEAAKIVGKQPSGSGTYLPTMVRDLEFQFDSVEEMVRAKQDLLDAGFRLIR